MLKYKRRMKKSVKIKKKLNNFFFDHFILEDILFNIEGWIIGLIAAAIFAFGFTCFTTPSSAASPSFTLVTGGISGLSQNTALIFKLGGITLGKNTIQAIGYTVFNIPILIFAFFKISKRFAIQSALNVAESSILIFLFSSHFSEIIASNPLIMNSVLTRVLVSAACTGISSAIAFVGDFSCGGIDVFSYYFALKKSTSVGKYSVLINTFIVSLYAVLMICNNPSDWSQGIVSLLYSFIYMFAVSLVIDFINLRNKKIQVQIITSKPNMAQILIANFPHGATIVDGKGAYSSTERFVVFMVVSNSEVKSVISTAKRVDEHAFISTTALMQVYGNFFSKPVS